MMNGVSPAVFLIMPMLGEKHPEAYPRFRDCFVNDDETEIHVYTRVGGGNRESDYGQEELMKHPNFLTTWDDDFDNTYGYYSFSVPDEWKSDFEKICKGDVKLISPEYKERLYKVFPKLKEQFDKLFKND